LNIGIQNQAQQWETDFCFQIVQTHPGDSDSASGLLGIIVNKLGSIKLQELNYIQNEDFLLPLYF
jgi:hypothetical protein